jgi:hypothetical protein
MSTAGRNVGTASLAFANQVEPIMEKALQGKHQFALFCVLERHTGRPRF